MKKVSLTLAAVLLSVSSLSYADIQVTDSENGAWIKVTENGKPAVNSVISVENQPQSLSSFNTDETGRVFIPLAMNHSSSVKFKAVTTDGNEYTRTAFHSVNKK